MVGLLVAATPAWAQDPATGPDAPRVAAVDSANGKLSEELLRKGDELARLRGRGATRVVIGAVMLGLGLVLGGVSAVLWENGGNSSSYGDLNGFYQGAIAMDTIAFGLIGGGTALVALGAGNITEGKRPRLIYSAGALGARF
jgi:hypothetical protein